jgi:hypothetical protein
MKRILVLGLLALALSRVALAANGYTLTRSIVGNGSALSSGGSYSLGATVGQLDAGALSEGRYTLGGGFWGGDTISAQPTPNYLPLVVR